MGLMVWLVCAVGLAAADQEFFNTTPPPVTSSFSCLGRPMGYYADVETNCRAYHTCDDHGNHFTHHCPEDTAFRQDAMICDHAYLVDCRANYEGAANARISQDSSHDAPPSDFVEPRGEGTNAKGYARSFRINQKDTAGAKYPTFVLNSSVFLKNREIKRPSTSARSQEPEVESTRTRVTQKDYKDNSVPAYQAQKASSQIKEDSAANHRPQDSAQRTTKVTSPPFRPQETSQRSDSASSSFRAQNSASLSASTPVFRTTQQTSSRDTSVTAPAFRPAQQTSSRDTSTTSAFRSTQQASSRNIGVTIPAFRPQASSSRNKDDPSAFRAQQTSNALPTASPRITISEELLPPLESSKFSVSSYADDYDFSFLQPPSVRDDNEFFQKNSFESLRNSPDKKSSSFQSSDISFDSVTFSPRTKMVLGMIKARNLADDFPIVISKPVNFLEPPHFKSSEASAAFARTSFNFRNDDYPYVETLRSIQNSKASASTKLASTIATTEASIFAVPTKQLASAGDLEVDPYYPRTPTTTEAYYTPKQQTDRPRKPFFTTTRRPQTSSTKFEIPAVLPDLNSLEDLLDRRKFFFIPQIKSV